MLNKKCRREAKHELFDQGSDGVRLLAKRVGVPVQPVKGSVADGHVVQIQVRASFAT